MRPRASKQSNKSSQRPYSVTRTPLFSYLDRHLILYSYLFARHWTVHLPVAKGNKRQISQVRAEWANGKLKQSRSWKNAAVLLFWSRAPAVELALRGAGCSSELDIGAGTNSMLMAVLLRSRSEFHLWVTHSLMGKCYLTLQHYLRDWADWDCVAFVRWEAISAKIVNWMLWDKFFTFAITYFKITWLEWMLKICVDVDGIAICHFIHFILLFLIINQGL